MRSLVIGGAGFVGKYLVRHLLELKHEVIITKMPMEEARVEGAAVYDLDILDKATVTELLDISRSGISSCSTKLCVYVMEKSAADG